MNQAQLNHVAQNYLMNQSLQVACKLRDFLFDDAEKRSKQIDGPSLYYIHNMALFICLMMINNVFLEKNDSLEAVMEYLDHAETLRPQFLDIVESLQDFEPEANNFQNRD